MTLPAARDLNFDLDRYINPYIPRNQLSRLPTRLSWFLGYRKSSTPDVGNVLVLFWSFVGAFTGLLFTAGIFRYSSALQSRHPPVIFASLGAASILEYNSITLPTAQPRNSILGHGLSALVGVAITKLFMLRSNFEDLRWIAGAVSCGAASSIMGITNTIHPPGGATAVLAAVDPTIHALGWMFVPLILLGSVLMLLVALIVNNIQRQFPVYWWTPHDVGHHKRKETDIEAASESKIAPFGKWTKDHIDAEQLIIIAADQVILPDGFSLSVEEIDTVRVLKARLGDQADALRTCPSTDTDETQVGD